MGRRLLSVEILNWPQFESSSNQSPEIVFRSLCWRISQVKRVQCPDQTRGCSDFLPSPQPRGEGKISFIEIWALSHPLPVPQIPTAWPSLPCFWAAARATREVTCSENEGCRTTPSHAQHRGIQAFPCRQGRGLTKCGVALPSFYTRRGGQDRNSPPAPLPEVKSRGRG